MNVRPHSSVITCQDGYRQAFGEALFCRYANPGQDTPYFDICTDDAEIQFGQVFLCRACAATIASELAQAVRICDASDLFGGDSA